MPYDIRKLKIIFFKLFSLFYRCYQESERLQKCIITQKIKIIVQWCLVAQMKRLDALITTQKPQLFVMYRCQKKSRKTRK